MADRTGQSSKYAVHIGELVIASKAAHGPEAQIRPGQKSAAPGETEHAAAEIVRGLREIRTHREGLRKRL